MEANAAARSRGPTPLMDFPFVRRFGDVALVALSSAIPTMPFIAAGASARRSALSSPLRWMNSGGRAVPRGADPPPSPSRPGRLAPWLARRRALKKVLKEHGAELVLHGHDHAETVHELETATGPAMIVGVPSASEAVAGRIPAARYNEYRIDKVAGGWRCDMVGRAVADTAAHVWECEHRVLLKP